MNAPKFKAGDRVTVKLCQWDWHVGNTYTLCGMPFQHQDVPDGDEWWYYIMPPDSWGGSVLPESVLEAA